MKHKNWIWDINSSIYSRLRFLRSLSCSTSGPAHALSIGRPISRKVAQEIHKEWMRNLLKNSSEYLATLEKQSLPQTCAYLRECERLI